MFCDESVIIPPIKLKKYAFFGWLTFTGMVKQAAYKKKAGSDGNRQTWKFPLSFYFL